MAFIPQVEAAEAALGCRDDLPVVIGRPLSEIRNIMITNYINVIIVH